MDIFICSSTSQIVVWTLSGWDRWGWERQRYGGEWRGAQLENNCFGNGTQGVALIAGPGIFKCDPRVKHVLHISVTTWVTHSWRKCLPAGNILGAVDYIIARNVGSPDPMCTKLASNGPEFSDAKVVYGNILIGNGQRWMLQPYQQSVALMTEHALTFSKPVDRCLIFLWRFFVQQY